MSAISRKNTKCQVKHLSVLFWWMFINDPMIHLIMNSYGKTEIYCLSVSVQIFKCFKWDAFKTIFSMKNETV